MKDAMVKLKDMCPKPMDTMLEKQTRAEALKKRSERSKMVVKDIPPTTPGTYTASKMTPHFLTV